MSGTARASGTPIALSTSSVYPERTPDAFEMAARLGYDGIEVMVYTDPVSQTADALPGSATITSFPSWPCTRRACCSPSGSWGREPWEKLRRAKELAERVGARVVVVHPPFRWQQGVRPRLREGPGRHGGRHRGGLRGGEHVPAPGRQQRGRAVCPALGSHRARRPARHAWTSRTPQLRAPTPWLMAAGLGDRLAHVHLADGTGTPRGPFPDEHLVPGRGHQPCAELLGVLTATGYPGMVVVEVNTNRAPTGRTGSRTWRSPWRSRVSTWSLAAGQASRG